MNLSSKNKPNPNFNMSSMTDLIFILLIFFLVTSSSSSIDFLPVDLPVSKDSKDIPKDDVTIFVTVKKDDSCDDKYQYSLMNGTPYCGWLDAELALIELVDKNINNEKKLSAIILVGEKNLPLEEIVKITGFASKYDYNIGFNVEKLDK